LPNQRCDSPWRYPASHPHWLALALQPSGEAVVQLTGLTGLEVMSGQWIASAGRVGSSDKAAMHRRRHVASVGDTHSCPFVTVHTRESKWELGWGVLKGSDALCRSDSDIKTSSHHFQQSKRINTSKSKQQTPSTYTGNTYHDTNPSTTTGTMSSHTTLKRTNSFSSTQSEGSISPSTRSSNENISKRRNSDNKGQVNFMQYGRHSNQWIFEPLKETAKSFFGKKDS
jgi:hypothetical protein